MNDKVKELKKLLQTQISECHGIADAFESYIVALEDILEELEKAKNDKGN